MTAARSTEAAMDTTTTAEAAVSRLAPEAFAERAAAIEREVGKVIVGQRELVRQTLTGLLANSHVLFKVMVPFPSEEDLVAIMDRTTGADAPSAGKVTSVAEIVEMQRLARAVPIAPHITAYAVSLLASTHPDQTRAPQLVRDYVRYG